MAAESLFVPEPAWVPAGRVVTLPGRGDTFVRAVGSPSSPTVMLLHGWMATGGLNWFTCFDALARDGWHVVAIDHRGHGRGVRTTDRFRLADCADDVAALAGVLGIDSFVACGYSMGGPISQLTWHRHRSLVSGLVLCATSRNFAGRPAERFGFPMLPATFQGARVVEPLLRATVGRRMRNRLADQPELAAWVRSELAGHDRRLVSEAGAAIGRFSSHRWIEGVDVPTSVVVTAQDRLVPPRRQRALASAIEGAEVFEVEGDHGAVARSADLFVPALVRALASVRSRGLRAAG